MPYKIKKSGLGYKVFSKSGNALSKKSLPLERAKKQLNAVNIAYKIRNI